MMPLHMNSLDGRSYMRIDYFVINLDDSPHRLLEITRVFNNLDIELNRISAVDGSKISLSDFSDDLSCRREMGRSLQPGEVGCFLSHIRALEAFLVSDADFAIILEDDATPLHHFKEAVHSLCHFISSCSYPDIAAINLGPSDYKYTSRLAKLDNIEILYAHRFAMLATGVLWTRDGASVFLSNFDKIFMPYDNYLRHVFANTHSGFSVYPMIVKSADFSSDIQSRNTTRKRSVNDRSTFYFFIKHKRVLKEKALAAISMIRLHVKF